MTRLPIFVLLALSARVFAQDLTPAQNSRVAAEPDRLHLRPNGSTRAAGRFRTRSYAGSPNEAARAFLKDNPALLDGLKPDRLRDLPPRRIAGRMYARFQQTIDGIPVRGAQAVVTLNASNQIESFTSHLNPALPVHGGWKLAAADARAQVAKTVDLEGEPRIEQVYVVRDGAAVPAWRVVARSSNPPGLWEYLISAEDGSVLESQSLRRGQQPVGYAYPRNPLQGPAERVALFGLGGSNRLTSDQTTIYNYLPAILGQVPPKTLVQVASRQNGNFLYAPDDPRFSEVQLFYGMQRANALFQDLGFPGWETPLAGVVLFQDYDSKQGRFVGANNAYFSPEDLTDNGGLFFYLTPNQGDTSLDSDVIFHEYTHAIVEYAVGPGQSARFQAINEGTADYFSDSFLDEATMAEFAAKMFGLRTSYLRRADNRNRWPYNVVGECHADGNIWSGALWDVRSAFGAEAANLIALYAVASLSPDADFFDAAAAAVDAAAAMYGNYTADRVADIMAQRGILTDAAQTASESALLTTGHSLSGKISAASPGRVRLGAQQYRIQVPPGATRLNIRATGSSDLRFYIRYRTPITIEDGYIVAEQSSQTGTDVSGALTLSNVPELQAGTYYIAVVNASQAALAYSVQADPQGDSIGKTLVTTIENGETALGSAPAGPFLASRQFAIDVPAGVTQLRVDLDGEQDIDLYIRYGGLVYIAGTGYPEADVSATSDSAHESIVLQLRDGSYLPAGRYFLAVLNYDGSTARYRVQAQLR